MSPSNRRRRRRVLPAILSAAFLVVAAAARGDDFLGNLLEAFGVARPEREPAAAIVVDAAPAFAGAEDAFVPQLKTLLRAELHFVRKVCSPDDAQMKEITRGGVAAVRDVAKRFADQQARNTYQWPDGRGLLARAVQKKVAEVMPAEAAARYADEVDAREQARKTAAAMMMTTLADRRVHLTPKQFDEVAAATEARWRDEWSQDFQMFLYEEYAPVPELAVISPVLTEGQRKAWGARSDQGRILFDWEHGLGLQWGGEVEIAKDIDLDAFDVVPAADAAARAVPDAAAEQPEDDGINRTHFDPKRRPAPDAVEEAS